MLGTLTLTPYDFWRRSHNIHHASSGNLQRARHRRHRYADGARISGAAALAAARYRLYRHPLVMFGLGPAYLFLLQHRAAGRTDAQGLAAVGQHHGDQRGDCPDRRRMIWLVGFAPFLLVHLPITLLAASIGVWLFYVQHQFEETTWAEGPAWNVHEAALHGSSHYDLPGVLRWFTANIGIHHVHHLCSRIPFYRLPQVLRDHPELAQIGRITLVDSLRLRASRALGRGAPAADLVRRAAAGYAGALSRAASGPRPVAQWRSRALASVCLAQYMNMCQSVGHSAVQRTAASALMERLRPHRAPAL